MDKFLELDINKNVNENANSYFEQAKKIKKKIKTIEDMLDKGVKVTSKNSDEKEEKTKKKKWYEHFRWFYSEKNFLIIAGKNANQNEKIYKNIMKENDLFMHAEIVGAPFTVIKNGKTADENTLNAAAQFAGSYSRAWKFGSSSVDVYHVTQEQLTKKTSGEYVKKGGIIILGERVWYKNISLCLCLGFYKGQLVCFPELCGHLLEKPIYIVPGKRDKENLAKEISKQLKVEMDEIVSLLPAGDSDIKIK